MRIEYVPDSAESWTHFYQSGDGFVGFPYQRGAGLGNVFRSIFRALLPIAKSAGKTIGREALSAGAQIASDVVAGENVADSFKSRSREAGARLLRKGADKLEGGRLGRTPIKRRKRSKRNDIFD